MNGYSMEFGMGSNGMSVKMSDFPERISISPVHRQKRDDDFYLVDRKAFPGKGTEYIRADHVDALVTQARGDALRDAAEVVNRNLGKPAHHAHGAILALIPTAEGNDEPSSDP